MKKTSLLFSVLFFITHFCFSQTNQEKARSMGKEAIELMDKGEYEKSIEILEECKKLDPKSYMYPYEIAYAHVQQKDYKKAIKILEKVKKYEKTHPQVYQMLGNSYSYSGDPKKAIATYEDGMKKFPNAGNLHSEKGNVLTYQKKYDEAVESYENGIKAEPSYSSNYYRLAVLFLSSTNKVPGLIYGEVFMNLERTTKRTKEMSEMLLKAYKEAIKFTDDGFSLDFCQIVVTPEQLKNEKFKLPFCAIFGKNFILGITLSTQKEVNLQTLSEIRTKFIEMYFQEDNKEYPHILFDYQKQLQEKGLFDAYNRYLFQIGASDEFKKWLETNQSSFDKFVEWYTKPENTIPVTKENVIVKN
ncbi:MAG: tetratricopeptide repeat protein [Raineya sp.]|jgi:tetratricopeptide (TPR) repeat protein|nr:tetratricopeptide repeat protein [Raineya sp.]